MTKIIFFELNEVTEEVFRESFSKFKYKKRLDKFIFNPTISKDKGHLSPWTTWATIHRGVTNEKHGIMDINQEIGEKESKYPTIMQSLINLGFKVGVFCSMHSASVPKENYSNYSFFIPEAFATDHHCNPKSVNNLQKLNLLMSKESARVVNKKLPKINLIIKASLSYLRHSHKLNGAISSIKQLLSEIISSWKKVRRRTLQPIILFDVYMDLLKKNKPDFSTFFTNHVASNMHRFWEAKFPDDYPNLINSNKWRKRYKNEIDNSMKATSYFLNELVDFVDKNKEFQLWILSSMGQAAVKDYKPGKSFWHIKNIQEFFSCICGKLLVVEELTQMIPHYSVKSDRETINLISDKLNSLESNAKFHIRSKTEVTISIYFETYDIEELWFKQKYNNNYLELKGIEKIEIDESTGSSAYHVPEGILYRYGNNIKKIDKKLLDENGFLETHKIKKLVEDILVVKN